MLPPVVRRTWAPRGQTPIQYSWDRRDRLSGIGALSLSPIRQQCSLFFQLYTGNIHADPWIPFIFNLHRHLRCKFILIVDRYVVHRQVARLLWEAEIDWVEVVWLPGYAPDLEPVEMVWGHIKYADLANFLPDDLDHLHREVTASLSQFCVHFDLLSSFVQHVHLPL
jgi:hypothetical protein